MAGLDGLGRDRDRMVGFGLLGLVVVVVFGLGAVFDSQDAATEPEPVTERSTTTVRRTTTTTLRRRPILEQEDVTTPLTVPPDEDMPVYAQPRRQGPAVSCVEVPCRPVDPAEASGCWEGGFHPCTWEENRAEHERDREIRDLENRIGELEDDLEDAGGYP